MANLLGYTLEEFIGMRTLSFHPVRSFLTKLFDLLLFQPNLSQAYALLLDTRALEHTDLVRVRKRRIKVHYQS